MPNEHETPAPPSSELQAGDPNTDKTPLASNPTSPAPSPQEPRGLNDAGLRYVEGDGVPSFLVGKTPKEAAQITADLYAALQRNEHISTPQTPSQAPPVSDTLPRVDPNLIYSNPDEYHRQMESRLAAMVDSRINAASSAIVTPLGSLARSEASRNAKYKAAWTKWPHEIDIIMQRVPEASRGRVDLWNEAARMVQGEHAEEIAEVRARELIATGDPGMLPTQGGPQRGASPSLMSPIEKLYADDHAAVKGYKADGIRAAQVIARASAQGISEDAYAKMLVDRASRSRKPQPIV